MPLVITDGCILCSACVDACPNHGISKGDVLYTIDQDSCTECVGFFNRPQCARVCPMDCCVLNPRIVLSEEALFERAKALHVNSDKQPILTADTSHFRRAAAGNRKAATPVLRQPEVETNPLSSTTRRSESLVGVIVRQYWRAAWGQEP